MTVTLLTNQPLAAGTYTWGPATVPSTTYQWCDLAVDYGGQAGLGFAVQLEYQLGGVWTVITGGKATGPQEQSVMRCGTNLRPIANLPVRVTAILSSPQTVTATLTLT